MHNDSPFNKYPSLHCVHDAAEAWLLLRPPEHQPHLTREGGGQPITHLRRDGVRLDVAELIFGVHQTPVGQVTGGRKLD